MRHMKPPNQGPDRPAVAGRDRQKSAKSSLLPASALTANISPSSKCMAVSTKSGAVHAADASQQLLRQGAATRLAVDWSLLADSYLYHRQLSAISSH